MKLSRPISALLALLIVSLACSFPLVAPAATATVRPSQTPLASFTPLPSFTPIPVTATMTVTATSTIPAFTTPVIAGAPSGPYAVVLVEAGDVLNIRSAPGAAKPIVGSFPPSARDVMRTGPSFIVADGGLWVEVQNPNGGRGWVNSKFLTEYVASSTFCADSGVTNFLAEFRLAILTSDGQALSDMVSPTHGMDVWLWNTGYAVNYDADHAGFMFSSTYVHNWGAHPASGLDSKGSFHDVVLPELVDVFNTNFESRCNNAGVSSYSNTWPPKYSNVNFYQIYHPGTAGNELNWIVWLVGVEYVSGRPYIFALIHFIWTP